jgi:hypothetical protein
MTGHLDADALAEYREGLTGRYRSARIRAHVARCPRCASLDDGLTEVTTLLAGAPGPKIPDELAARLDGVLAAESAARARAETPAAASQAPAAASEAPVAAGDPAGAAPAPGPGPRHERRPAKSRSAARPSRPRRVTALRAASVTAALLVLAGGGYGVSRLVHTGGGGVTASSAGTAQSSPRGGAGAHARPAGGTQPTVGTPVQPGIKLPTGGVPVVRSGTDYQPGRLAVQAKQILARYHAGSARGTPAFGARLGSAMTRCVKLVTGGAPPSLVDAARYRGQPATVIIQAPAIGRPGQIWVVGSGCSATGRDLIARAQLARSG